MSQNFEATAVLKVSDQSNNAFRRMASQVSSLNAKMAQTGQRMQDIGSKLAVTVAAPIIGAMGVAIKQASAFQDVIIDIGKVSGASDAELGQYGDQLTALANKFGLNRSEMGELALGFVQAGKSMEEAAQLSELATRANIGLGISIDELSNRLPKMQNAFALSSDGMSELLDLMNSLSDSTASTAAEIFQVSATAGLAAKNFGLSALELAAFSSALIAGNVDADRAATSLEAAFVNLADLTSGTKGDALAAMGLDAKAMTNLQRTKPVEFLLKLTDALRESGNAQVLANKLAQRQGARALQALADENSVIRQNLELAYTPSLFVGSVDAEVARRMGAFSFQLERFQNTSLNVLGSFADPHLEELTEKLKAATDALNAFNDSLSDSEKKGIGSFLAGTVLAIGGLFALGTAIKVTAWAFAPLVKAVAGLGAGLAFLWTRVLVPLGQGIAIAWRLAGGLNGVLSALRLLVPTMAALAAVGVGPLRAIAAVIGLTITGIIGHWDYLKERLGGISSDLFGGVVEWFKALGSLFTGDLGGFVEHASNAGFLIGRALLSGVTLLPDMMLLALGDMGAAVLDMLPESWRVAIDDVLSYFPDLLNGSDTIYDAMLAMFQSLGEKVGSIFSGIFDLLLSGIADVLSLLPESIRPSLQFNSNSGPDFSTLTNTVPAFVSADQTFRTPAPLGAGQVGLDPNSRAEVDVNLRINGPGEVASVETRSEGDLSTPNVGVQRIEFDGDF